MMNINVTTRSGKIVDLTNPQADKLKLSDIANSLARQNRFNGNLENNYTVLEHSMCGANLFVMNGMYGHAITFLMHDAHEAYIGDIVSPVKRYLRMHTSALEQLEKEFNEHIWLKFMPDNAVRFDDTYVSMLDKYLGNQEHRRGWGLKKTQEDSNVLEDQQRVKIYGEWSPFKCSLSVSRLSVRWKVNSKVQRFVHATFDDCNFNPNTEKLVEIFAEYYHQLLGQLMLEEIKARKII